jgi:hypothetical protein
VNRARARTNGIYRKSSHDYFNDQFAVKFLHVSKPYSRVLERKDDGRK